MNLMSRFSARTLLLATLPAVCVFSGTLLAVVPGPIISATKDDGIAAATRKLEGSTITYTNTITNSGTDATGVAFEETTPAHTSLVAGSIHISPLAINDSYAAVGNTLLEVGVAASGNPAVTSAVTPFANDVTLNSGGGTDTRSLVSRTNPANGTLVSFDNGTGKFSYLPNVGFTGTDTFTYTLQNDSKISLTDTATVTITVSNRVWYVKNGAGGDGRSGSPSGNPAAISTSADAATDIIYVFNDPGTLSGAFTLDNNQQLLGNGVALVVNSSTLRVAGATPGIANNGAVAVTLGLNNTLSGFNIGNSSVAVTGSSVGTLNINNVGINSNGGALDLTGVATPVVNINLSGLTSSGGTKNVNLVGLNGTIALGSGALSNASGNAFDVSGSGNAVITYSGTIANSTARLVNVSGKNGGSITLSGAITGSGTGTGVSLVNNTGSTIGFTGGVVVTTTGANKAFSATGGGTISVTGANNTLASAGATALEVANTTIGASALTFKSISSSAGAGNGIILDTTGSNTALTVTGSSSAGSGGTITGKTGSDTVTTSGIGVYLNNTKNVSLAYMSIQGCQNYGIRGKTVNGFVLDNSVVGTTATNGTSDNVDPESGTGTTGECSLRFTDLTGTVTFSNDSLDRGLSRTMLITNNSSTMNMGVTNSTVNQSLTSGAAGTAASDAIFIDGVGTSVTNLTVTGSHFTSYRQFALQGRALNTGTMNYAVSNCDFSNSNTANVSAAGSISLGGGGLSGGDIFLTYNIHDNTFRHGSGGTTPTNGGAHLVSGVVSGVGTCYGKFVNNTVGVSGVANSGSGGGGDALRLFHSGSNGSHGGSRYLVQGNTIQNYGEVGIQFNARQDSFVSSGPNPGTIDATVLGNTIRQPGTPAQGAFAAIWVNAGVVAADRNVVNIAIGGSNAADKNTLTNSDPNNFSDVFLDCNSPANAGAGAHAINLYRNGSVAAGSGEALVRQILVDDNVGPLDLLAGFTNASTIGAVNGLPAQAPLLIAPGGIEKAAAAPEMAFANVANFPNIDENAGIPTDIADIPTAPKTTPVATTKTPGGAITQTDLDSIVSAAIARWEAAGLNDKQIAKLRGLSFEVTALGNLHLGEANGNVIRVDPDAGGNGWFVDATTKSDELFGKMTAATRLYTDPASAPAGRIDLLTAVLHEMGHALGLEDSYVPQDRDSLMYGFLTQGERRLPANGQATGAMPHADGVKHFLDVSIPIGTLPAGKSVTISYDVQIDNPVTGGATQIESQDTVSGSNFVSVLTDDIHLNNPGDPVLPGAADKTVTLLGIPPAVTTQPTDQVVNLGSSVTFTAAASGVPAPTVQWRVSTNAGVSFSNVPGATSTTLTFTPTAAQTGNQYRAVFTNMVASATSNSALLTVVVPPVIANNFGVSAIPLNGSTSLTFTITNNNASTPLTGAAFTDSLPAGLVVATPNGLSGNIGGGTLTATQGASSVSLAGATIPAGGSITFSVDVTGTSSGVKNNSVLVTSTEGSGNTANASLTVVAPATITHSFGASSIPLNGSTTLSFTVTNPNGAPNTLNGIGFSETLPAGLVVATPNGASGGTGGGTVTAVAGSSSVSLAGATLAGSGSITFSINVTGTTAGTKSATSGNITSTEGGTGGNASASLDVVAPPVMGIAFSPAAVNVNGTSTLTYTLTNPAGNPAALSGVSFTNTLPAGLVIAAPNALSNTAGGTATAVAGSGSVSLTGGGIPVNSSVTVTVNVTSAAANTYNNSVSASSTNGGTGNTANATLLVRPPVDHFAITSVPATATAGSAFDVTVAAQDAANATVTGYVGNVHFTSTAAAVLPADATLTNGTGTFSVTLKTSGSHTVSATDTVTLSATGTSSAITVSPAAIHHFAVSGPAAATAGTPVDVGVTAQDQFDNAVTAYSGTAHLTSSDGSAILPADSALISGFANFSVNFSTGGGQTVTATDTVTAAITGTSTAISVTPQADLAVTITDGPDPASAGGNLTYVVTVTNNGPSTADSPSVSLTTPASTTFLSAVPSAGTTSDPGVGATGTVLFSPGDLGSGASASMTVTVKVDSNFVNNSVISATATASTSTGDPTGANNSATTTTTLVLSADLSITKTDGVTTATSGGSVTYTITASNAGPSNITGATVTDILPASITGDTWTGVGAGGGTGPASGSGNINASNINLPAGGSFTFTVSSTISASAAGFLSNTATVSNPAGVTDPTPGNNSATDVDTLTQSANLAITKTDGVTTAVPGGSVTYTITASNSGPSDVVGATLADTLPASLTATWTAVGAAGGTASPSGSGNINDLVNLPVGGSVTFTVSAGISPAATGSLINTATITSSVTDTVPGNNSATDTDTLTPQADLTITKTDGVATAVPGNSVTYTITAANAGPSNVTGATVSDTLPASLTGTWTAVGAGGGTATASGAGNISDTVNLPVGASVTYTVTAAISGSAMGTLSNTATVTAPGGVTDSTPGNNSATDTDTLTPQADLTITKTDGVTTAVPGNSVTYTITASNAGPSTATGATVADTLPASISGATWTAVGAGGGTATASGSGNISDSVTLPAGASVTYTVTAPISASATGTLSNTATVTAPGGVTDSTPGNNSATDTDTLTPQADLAITKTDGVVSAVPGASVTYTITASNAGPSIVTGATVADTLPASISGATWTAVGAGGGTATASGSGNISDSVNLPVGGSVTYTVTAPISAAATGTLSNTATVTAPAGVTDSTPGNNSATDTDTLTPTSDLTITKTDGVATAIPGGNVTYTITASNAGPSNATGATVADTLPAIISGATWTAVGAGGGTATASGSGNINGTVNLPAGGSVTYTVTAPISASATGTLSNTATVTAPGSVTDPTPANNSATDSDTLTPSSDLTITKTDSATTAIPGGSVTYTITASNAGPSNSPGSIVTDTLPASISGATWTAVGAGGGTATASGSGNINDTVNLPAGGSVTYTVTAPILSSATGTLSNTATVNVPGSVTDPTPGNNSATDSDTLTPRADLAITKTDGITVATPGTSVTYTITVSNAGPSNAPGSTVADTLPASISGASWTAVGAGGGTATVSGSGNINDAANLPVGGSVTYTVTAPISSSATGTLSNTAIVSAPGSVTDPTPGNNSATDSDTLTPRADLAITKTDGVTTAVPGTSVTYTITASNAGPSNATTATVADTLPAIISGATWTAVGAGGGTATAAGSGNINDTVNLPVGGSVTYTVTAPISSSATGTLSNTATVSSAITDPTPGNNGATDTDTLTPQADLAITKTDGVVNAVPGNSVTYTITASNAGPSNASGSAVADTLPAIISGATWTAVGAGGGTATASGSGNINDTVNLPAGGSVTYTVTAPISASATGTLSNTATVGTSGGVTDPTPGNNSATDTDTLTPQADLAVTITDSPDPVNALGNLTYTITLTSTGPSTAVSPTVSLPLPPSTTFVSANAPGIWSTTAPAVGAVGTVTFSDLSLASGASVVFTVVAKVDINVVNDSTLTATATTTSATNDPAPGNNSATTTTLAKSGADLQITMVDSPDPVIAGTDLTYTIQVQNNGPLAADNVSITDALPAGTTFVSLTTPDGWSATTPAVDATGTITITHPNFANAGTGTFTLVAKVASNVADATVLSNSASVSSTTVDIAPVNNVATATTTVTTQSDLAIEIAGTPTTAPKGSDVSFAITLTNNGPSDASAPNVSLPIPSQMTFVSVTTPGGWSATTPAVGGTGTVNFSAASLATGSTVNFTVVAKVNYNAPSGTIITAIATASATGVDPVPASNTDSASAAVGTVNPTAVQPVTTGIHVTSQTGLFDVMVNVTNTTPLPINGFRLHVNYNAYKAAYPSLRLYNATSPVGSSDVYIDYPFPVAVDGTVAVKLSFYTSTRTFPSPFSPILTVDLLGTSQVTDTNGGGVQPGIALLPDTTVLLEFPSTVGHWYRVRYSADMVHWQDCPVPIQAGTTRMQWIDSGPPFTDVPPSQAPSRYYRVNEISAP